MSTLCLCNYCTAGVMCTAREQIQMDNRIENRQFNQYLIANGIVRFFFPRLPSVLSAVCALKTVFLRYNLQCAYIMRIRLFVFFASFARYTETCKTHNDRISSKPS